MATAEVLQPVRSDARGLLRGGQLGTRFHVLFEGPAQEAPK